MPPQAGGMVQEFHNMLTGKKGLSAASFASDWRAFLIKNGDKISGLGGESPSNDDDVDWSFCR